MYELSARLVQADKVEGSTPVGGVGVCACVFNLAKKKRKEESDSLYEDYLGTLNLDSICVCLCKTVTRYIKPSWNKLNPPENRALFIYLFSLFVKDREYCSNF